MIGVPLSDELYPEGVSCDCDPDGVTAFAGVDDLRLLLLLLAEAFREVRGESDGNEACNFCLCLNNKSRRAKHRSQTGHWNGFSLV